MATGRANDGVGFVAARWLAAALFTGPATPTPPSPAPIPPPWRCGRGAAGLARWGLASERTRADVHAMPAELHGGPVSSFRTALAGGNAAMQHENGLERLLA
jgi:hypothetical protein